MPSHATTTKSSSSQSSTQPPTILNELLREGKHTSLTVPQQIISFCATSKKNQIQRAYNVNVRICCHNLLLRRQKFVLFKFHITCKEVLAYLRHKARCNIYCFYNKKKRARECSPIALDKFKLPFTRPIWMKPLAFIILSLSAASSGLWSRERLYAYHR